MSLIIKAGPLDPTNHFRVKKEVKEVIASRFQKEKAW